MSDASVEHLRGVWKAAPERTAPWPEDDDFIHMTSINGKRREEIAANGTMSEAPPLTNLLGTISYFADASRRTGTFR